MDHFKYFKGCLPQIWLHSFLNTLSHVNGSFASVSKLVNHCPLISRLLSESRVDGFICPLEGIEILNHVSNNYAVAVGKGNYREIKNTNRHLSITYRNHKQNAGLENLGKKYFVENSIKSLNTFTFRSTIYASLYLTKDFCIHD